MPERSCTETEMIRRKRRFSCRTGGPMEHYVEMEVLVWRIEFYYTLPI
jgi:hypothetical protein